jgi:tetratricopeptide (TPR) repeat protein
MKPFVAGLLCTFLSSSVLAQDADPIEPRTWFTEAAYRIGEIKGQLAPSGGTIGVSDTMLASMIYDRLQDEATAATLEALAKQTFEAPPDLPKTSVQRPVYDFTQLGHLQVAYMPLFAKMSADAAHDLFRKAESPDREKALTRMSIARLWVRLGEPVKALELFDAASPIHVEERVELIRTAYAAAKVDVARSLAGGTLAHILQADKESPHTLARHLATLVETLVDCDEIESAREAMTKLPPSEDALRAYRALLEWDRAHGEEDAFASDLNAMLEMLGKMGEFDWSQTNACVKAAEICVKLRRGAEAVACLNRLDQLADQPDPPLTLPGTWAEAARISLYTTANDRADQYLARCAKAIAADTDASDEDKLRADIAMARVYAVGGNIEEFNKRLATINERQKTIDSFFAKLAIRDLYLELARVTRDESLLAQITAQANQRSIEAGPLAMALTMRNLATGQIDEAWKLASRIYHPHWRLRALIEVTHARLQIYDDAERLAALLDVRGLPDPRVAAYVSFAVGARLEGSEGYAGDRWMRSNGLD